jgi:hypothetical protein
VADKHSFVVRNNESTGCLEVSDETITLKLDGTVNIKRNYVASLEKTSDLALGRVAAVLYYYDMFGNRESVSFVTSEADFRALKKLFGK